MKKEIEAKYKVDSPQIFESIRSAGEVGGFKLEHVKVARQKDIYLDTATGFFFRNGASFRIREKQGKNIATFKGKADQQNSLARTEVEEILTTEEVQVLFEGKVGELSNQAVKMALDYSETSELSPVLQIENNREAWRLNVDGHQIKLCFDDAIYTSNSDRSHSAQEYEIELELRSEQSEESIGRLREISSTIAEQYQLSTNLLSKYERAIERLDIFSGE